MNNIFVIKYTGTFGFIKPFHAVRDGVTFSQKFLTPSILIGIEQKLFPELLGSKSCSKIYRHKLVSDENLSFQLETTRSKQKNVPSVLKRGLLLNPTLYIAFNNLDDAEHASTQHICLSRNEDVLYPSDIFEMTECSFDELTGFEIKNSDSVDSLLVGFNRFDNMSPMYIDLIIK